MLRVETDSAFVESMEPYSVSKLLRYFYLKH